MVADRGGEDNESTEAANERAAPHPRRLSPTGRSRRRIRRRSAWVAANAGSGKTHVLAQRVIRLLLDGVDPARILCLTFTKAAAANMANRVFDELRKWTALDDAGLDAAMQAAGVSGARLRAGARARRCSRSRWRRRAA